MATDIGLQQRKNQSRLVSESGLDDQCVPAPYSARMREPDRNPYDSASPQLFADFPAGSAIGIHVRRGDAELRIQEMAEAEEGIREQEIVNAQITDRIERKQAEHQLNMEYLIRFGVSAAERAAFREILKAVAEHGGLSLRQAAEIARARTGKKPMAIATVEPGISH